MVAAEGGHVETVVTLIKFGANVNLKGWVSCRSQNLKCYDIVGNFRQENFFPFSSHAWVKFFSHNFLSHVKEPMVIFTTWAII